MKVFFRVQNAPGAGGGDQERGARTHVESWRCWLFLGMLGHLGFGL